MKQRSILLVVLILGLVLAGVPVAARQESAPLLASAGYPEVVITVSDSGVTVPGSVTAGRVLLTYRNTGADSRHAFFARLPDDATIGSLLALSEADAPPDWLMQSTYPGFPSEVLPGQETHAVVDLTPGMYLVVEDFSGVIVVTPSDGEQASPSPVADPESAVTISLFEYGFQIPDNLTSGDQVWQVVNAGRVPHELLIASVPDGTTVDAIANAFQTNTDLEITPAGGIGWLSPGAVGWTEVDLAPGTYAALCFVYDPETGMPHAMEGMIAVFTVA